MSRWADPIIVNVRWLDGYLETFYDVSDARASASLLSLVFTDKRHRQIPLASVRWYSLSQESHEVVPPHQGVSGRYGDPGDRGTKQAGGKPGKGQKVITGPPPSKPDPGAPALN